MKLFMNVHAKGESSGSRSNNQGAGRDTNRVPRVQMGGLSSRRSSGALRRLEIDRPPQPSLRNNSQRRLGRAGLSGNGSRQMTLF